MKTEALFAVLIRGNLIAKTGRPWTVTYEAAGSGSPDSALLIKINDENEAAGKIASGFKDFNGAEAKQKIVLDFAGKKYVYHAEEACCEACNCHDNSCCAPVSGMSGSLAVLNRIALVTGGAQGFGEEIVRGLVNAGTIVFIADLNLSGAEKLAESLNKKQGRAAAYGVEVNVADEASVEKLAETIALKAGGLDLCVSNAGVLRASPILEQDITSFRFVTDINYTAFAIITKHCGLLMKIQNQCAPYWITDIIQINSKSGLEGSNKNGSYAGSKFGSIGLVQSFAKELVDYRIKVNAVCPGNFFDGPLWADPEKGLFVQYLKTGKVPGAKTIEDVKAFYEAKVPMGRGCTGPDVLKAVLYLVDQVYETGQALPVTGGQVMLS